MELGPSGEAMVVVLPRRPAGGSGHRWLPATLLLICLVLLAGPVGAEDELDWSSAEATPVLDELDAPADFAIAPDGEIWFTEFLNGNLTRYDPETETRETVFETEPIPNATERGLVGLALDPGFPDNGVFYVYYTVHDPQEPENGTNYLSRVEDGEETRLLEVPAYKRHNGGRIEFDEEGRMFVSTGDNSHGYGAPEPDNRLGKILHLHPNGTPAEDTIEGYVYSLGHRNVYGLAYDSANDRLFATENGADQRDEVNLIEAGNNYGWPKCMGDKRYDHDNSIPLDEPCEDDNLTNPIGVFYDNRTVAPTGATMFHGDLYWAAWKPGEIHRMRQDPETGAWNDTVVLEIDGDPLDLETHNGTLYVSDGGNIYRVDALDREAPVGGDLVSEVPTSSLVLQALAVLSASVALRRP